MVREASFGSEGWRARWLADLDAAVLGPDAAPAGAVPDASTLRPQLLAALAPWLAVAEERPFRAHLDPGGAALAAVVDPSDRLVWLGSPRFALERRLSALGAGGAGPDVAEAAGAFAGAWLAAELDDTPLDIAVSTRASGLPDLLADSASGELAPVLAEARSLAERLDAEMGRYRPGLLERLSQWGLGLQADHVVLRIHALRFVALLPSLDHDRSGVEVQRLLAEMMRRTLSDSRADRRHALPGWLDLAFAVGLAAVSLLPAGLVAGITRTAVRKLAGIFIAGESIEGAADALDALRETRRAATVDQLGELVVSEVEADRYRDEVLDNIRGVASQFGDARNSAGIPLAHVSVKVSALCAHYDADDEDGTWARVGPRLVAILQRSRELGVFVHIDAEHYAVRDLTFHLLARALRSDDALWRWRDVGIVVQAYLRDAPAHLAEVLALGRERGVAMPLRLVKGAYWDAETTEADAHSYDAPQWLNKAETDLCFQQLVMQVLAHGEAAQLCIGSHNLRDHCFARAVRARLHPEAPEIEHQALHATYEALSVGMARMGWSVRNYIPVGSLLVGMAYLVRRIMENSSQVGVLTMARGGVPLDETLRPPAEVLRSAAILRRPTLDDDAAWPPFASLAPARLYRPAHRAAFESARAEERLVRALPRAQAAAPRSGPPLASLCPSEPSRSLGEVPTCTSADVAAAVATAAEAWPAWQAAGAPHRAALLLRAAERMSARRDDWAVLVALEAGKARAEALGDVDEAVDFLRFYADEARRFEGREARGVIAVVAPWNFPLAIPCGMTTAALAVGNCALLKSAEQTPLVAEALVALLHEVGVPPGVVQHLPGDGPTVGAPLVAASEVAGVVFTGSKTVGTLLHSQLAAAPHTRADGRVTGKLVITEMGGKNAVVITANADLDEATGACLKAAYGHAGQKCSAASRLLVDRRVFTAFSERFARAAGDLHVGPALAPGTQVNAVISAEDQARLLAAQRAAAEECGQRDGRVLLAGGEAPEAGLGVRPAVFQLPAEAALAPDSHGRRELFGPVVHTLPFDDLDDAVRLANGTEYALTGGIFAQSEDDIATLSAALSCGNLYVNRSNTGARVKIEPFGGFWMSGTGPKAGGVDYLEAFLAPVGERGGGAGAAGGPAALDVPEDAALAGLPTWPLCDADATTEADDLLAIPLASQLTELDGADPAVVEVARGLAEALRDARRPPPRATLRIPGQETEGHLDRPRGRTVILAARSTPGPTGVAHLLAALGAGCPALVVAPGAAYEGWLPVIKAARDVGLPLDRVELIAAADAGEAAAWASLGDLATLVIDGPRAPWSALLSAALARREAPRSLPRIWCAADGPDLRAPAALVRSHLLVRTIAVNTMRHGAPLSLDG